ncbi:MAG: hypothetical protein IJ184_01160 [Alphaproteobacteria bacterium]|nr:hypothetical protein [Alphaproteobacteria bacterium]
MAKKLEVKELNIEHLAAVMELQNKVVGNLQEDEKHFVLTRSAQDFIKALEHEHTYMLGVFDGEKLVAQSIFSYPQNGQVRDMPEFDCDTANDKLVVYKAILVDVEHRGSGLMKSMLDYIEKKSKAMGKTTSIIQIAIDNPASWISALANGMSIRKVDYDPTDGAKVLYLAKNLQVPTRSEAQGRMAMFVGKNIHREIPALFNKMQYRVAQGYYGVGIDKNTHSLIWEKPRDNAAKNRIMTQPLVQASGQGRTTRY